MQEITPKIIITIPFTNWHILALSGNQSFIYSASCIPVYRAHMRLPVCTI